MSSKLVEGVEACWVKLRKTHGPMRNLEAGTRQSLGLVRSEGGSPEGGEGGGERSNGATSLDQS